MIDTKYIKLLGLIFAVVIINILVFSPGIIGVEIGGDALQSAFGVTLLLASVLALLYGSYIWLFRPPDVRPVRHITTHEEYVEALARYRHVRSVEGDVVTGLEQLERLTKKNETLYRVLNERFDPAELSYKKFASVIQEVAKLFYLNVKSILNRLHVFDEAEFERVMSQKTPRFSQRLLQEKRMLYQDFLSFMADSLGTNEEILLKLDKLLLEISRLDSLDPGDIENMPCMQEIDSLIKQTKYYKQ